MLRYPTKESGWKANIKAWWIGFGIDIASGEIVSMYNQWKIYTDEFEEKYKELLNYNILLKVKNKWDKNG